MNLSPLCVCFLLPELQKKVLVSCFCDSSPEKLSSGNRICVPDSAGFCCVCVRAVYMRVLLQLEVNQGRSGHDSWPVERSLEASWSPPTTTTTTTYQSFSLGGLCSRASGAGYHCAESAAATGELLLGWPWSHDQDFSPLLCACACLYMCVHPHNVLIRTSCVQQCGGAEMGLKWPLTRTTCPCVSADHPHFRLQASLLPSQGLRYLPAHQRCNTVTVFAFF